MLSRAKACEILDAIESLDESELTDDVYEVLYYVYDILKQGIIDSLTEPTTEAPVYDEPIAEEPPKPAVKKERKVITPETITKDQYEQLKSTTPGRKPKTERVA